MLSWAPSSVYPCLLSTVVVAMTPPTGRVWPQEAPDLTNISRHATPIRKNLSVPLQNQIIAAVAAMSRWSVYPPEYATRELSTGQCLLLALLHGMASGQRYICGALTEMANQIPQLRSSFLKVWITDDYNFCKEWLAQAFSTAASMVHEGSVTIGGPALAAFSSLPAKYSLAEYYTARRDFTALGFITYLANISSFEQSVNNIQKPKSERATEEISEGLKETTSFGTTILNASKDPAGRGDDETKPTFSKRVDRIEVEVTETGQQIAEVETKPTGESKDINSAVQRRLVWAIERDIRRSASAALADGADVNLVDDNGHTPLSLAALKGHKNVAGVLLTSGASVNSVTQVFGASPLCLAAMAGHDEMVGILLDEAADSAAMDHHGLTPLHRAAECGRLVCVKMLLIAGANVNTRAEDDRSSTPLQLAAEQGNVEVVELLLKHGADPNAFDNYGWTALTSASIKGHLPVSKILTENGGIDITRINKFLNPAWSFRWMI